MRKQRSISSRLRTALLLFAGLCACCMPIETLASDSCFQCGNYPTPTCSTATSSYISLSWSSFSSDCCAFYSSPRYVVYRSTSSTFSWSSVTKLATTTSRSYTDYSAAYNTSYYYWIGVIDSDTGATWVGQSKRGYGYRPNNNCMQTTPNPQPTASISNSSYIYVSWPTFSCSSFSGKYVVYRSTSSTFSWNSVTRLATTYNKYYYDYSAAYNTTYYYWIGVIDNSGKIYVQDSKKDWGKRPRPNDCMQTTPNPQPTATTSNSSYIYISWPTFSCSSFSGKYVVYRSTSSTFSWSSATRLVTTYNRYYYDYAPYDTTYYYWIGVMDNSGKIYVQDSKKDWGKRPRPNDCMQTTPNPQPTASINNSNYIYISWPTFSCSSFSGKYVVYRSTSSTFSWSSATRLVTTYNKYYYDYSASYNTQYYYWIGVMDNSGKIYVQDSKKDWGKRPGTCMQTTPNPQPTASISYSSYVYISWPTFSCSLFSGKYVIYRSTSSTFSWNSVTRVATTYNRYYYDYSASYNTRYYYWIGVMDNSGKIYVQESKKNYGYRY